MLKKAVFEFSKISIWAFTFFISFQIFIGMALGYIAAKFLSGQKTGEKGRINSLIFHFKGYKLHFHHWLYSALMLLALVFHFGGSFTFQGGIICGALGGSIFHGIFSYKDWHKIIVRKNNGRI